MSHYLLHKVKRVVFYSLFNSFEYIGAHCTILDIRKLHVLDYLNSANFGKIRSFKFSCKNGHFSRFMKILEAFTDPFGLKMAEEFKNCRELLQKLLRGA